MAAKKASVELAPPAAPAVDFTEPQLLLLDIPHVAHALCATPWSVRTLLWSGQIPYIKIGRKFLVDPNDLRAFIARQKEAA
jgi:hypothetical protein